MPRRKVDPWENIYVMRRINPPVAESAFRKLPDYIQRVATNKSVDQLITEINETGWLVNNLFQMNDGAWRANLRFVAEDRNGIRSYFHEFADAHTPVEALAAAKWNMEQKRNDPTRGTSTVIYEYSNQILILMVENGVAQLDFNRELRKWLQALTSE